MCASRWFCSVAVAALLTTAWCPALGEAPSPAAAAHRSRVVSGAATPVVGLSPGASTPQTSFKAGVDLVRLDVIVTKGDRPVTGLSAKDFEILDDGVVQTPALAARADDAAVLMALDTSDSVAGEPLRALAAAARGVVDQLGPSDRVGLLGFSETPYVLGAFGAGQGAREAVASSLETLSSGGRTALYDAIVTGLRTLSSSRGGALLLVFTDGEDTSSVCRSAAAIEAVKRSEVMVATVSVGLQRGSSTLPSGVLGERREFLRSLGDVNGGPRFSVEYGGGSLQEAFARVMALFRFRYVLTYKPTGVDENQGWHTVTVRVARHIGQAWTRAGYYAAAAGAVAPPCDPGEPADRPPLVPIPRPWPRVPPVHPMPLDDPSVDPATLEAVRRLADEPYETVVREFRSGNRRQAVRALASWDRDRLLRDTGSKGLLDDAAVAAAVAVLHTEVAFTHPVPHVRQWHLQTAERLIETLGRQRFDSSFRKTWYLLAESWYGALGERASRERLAARIYYQFPNDAEVALMWASASEILAQTYNPLVQSPNDQMLVEAEGILTRLVAAVPSHFEARLRLGRVCYLRSKPDRAAAEFERVRREATDPRLVYLANLFLGQIHEKARRFAQATGCYEAAMAAMPGVETAAAAALSHLQGTGGRTLRADWALTTVTTPGPLAFEQLRRVRDPWELYSLGQYWQMDERLARLRAFLGLE